MADSKAQIGLVRGGQLGRLFIETVLAPRGISTVILDSDPEAPCRDLATRFLHGNPNSPEDFVNFGRQAEAVVVEFEDVSVEGLARLEAEGTPVFPSSSILRMVQDKGLQKQFYLEQGFPTADFLLLQNKEELLAHGDFFPAVQKSRRAGYDGKGVQVLNTVEDAKDRGWDLPSVLERQIPFVKEIAIMVARNAEGEIVTYPLVEMDFHPTQNLVEFLLCPAQVDETVAHRADELARRLAEALHLVGILAVECFVLADGQVLINEISPRFHNSAHHTIEANETSQYEQLYRIVQGMSLGSPALKSPAAMVNVLGAEGHVGPAVLQGLDRVMEMDGVFLHWYGKKETRPFRKMGHVTAVGANLEEAKAKAKAAQAVLEVVSA